MGKRELKKCETFRLGQHHLKRLLSGRGRVVKATDSKSVGVPRTGSNPVDRAYIFASSFCCTSCFNFIRCGFWFLKISNLFFLFVLDSLIYNYYNRSLFNWKFRTIIFVFLSTIFNISFCLLKNRYEVTKFLIID